MKRERHLWGLFLALVCSMAVTEWLLLMEGRWREAVPLHLCSISAMAAALLAWGGNRFLLDFLWYLGMPGAALALLFPAPASSVCQPLLDASYFATHVLILLIPIVRICQGMRPRKGKTKQMMLTLSCIALLAAAANRMLHTDFLFLAAPPAGTPLEAVFRFGYMPYWLTMFLLMLLLCLTMDAAAGRMKPKAAK